MLNSMGDYMKKIIAVVLITFCFVGLVACESQKENKVDTKKDLVQQTESLTEQSTQSTEQTEKVTELETQSKVNTTKENKSDKIYTYVNGKQYEVELYDNETANSFKKFIPCELTMSELNGNEIYTDLSMKLPSNSSVPEKINKGDIMLFGESCIVVFYDSFQTSYSYTPIGRLKDTDNLENYIIDDNMVSFSN